MVHVMQRRGAFRARDEAGAVHVIHRYEVTTGPRGAGEPVLVADRGGSVRRLDRGHYELVGPRAVRLRSDDPEAP